jgi:5'(3')-deoxyribonucleotidase
MNKEKTIILDLDDTIANLKDPMCNLLKNYSKKDVHWDKWDCFNIVPMYEINDEEFYSLLIDSSVLDDIKLYDGSREVMDKLIPDHKIVIISSRNYHPDAYNVTKRWLDKNSLPYDNLHISGNGIKKSSYAKIYDNVVAAVDDNVDNCEDFYKNCGINNTLLMDQPWNASNKTFHRIHALPEMLKLI